MERLNIPLSGYSAARRKRRAVWHWAGVPLLFILVFSSARLIATKNQLRDLTPENTILSIHLRPSQNQWEKLIDWLGNEVIAESGVTLNELRPHITGSIAMHLTSGGEKYIGFAGNLPETAKKELEQYGIWVNTSEKNRVVLGKRETSFIQGNKQSALARLHPKYLGSIIYSASGEETSLRLAKNHIDIVANGFSTAKTPPPPVDADFYATFEQSSDLLNLPLGIDLAFRELSGNEDFSLVLEQLTHNGGRITVSDDQFSLVFNNTVPQATLKKLLRFQSGLTNPDITAKRLRDGSNVNEIRLPSTSQAPEELEDAGWQILRIESGSGTTILAAQKDNQTILTNSSNHLLALTHPEKQNDNNPICGNSFALAIKTSEFKKHLLSGEQTYSNTFPLLNSTFVHVGVDKTPFGTKIRLCDTFSVDNSFTN